jgi:hypothetical protein
VATRGPERQPGIRRTTYGDDVFCELPATGLRPGSQGVTSRDVAAIAATGFFIVLPLGGVGLTLGLTADDFEPGLRLLVGAAGALGAVAAVLLPLLTFGLAYGRSGRVQISPGGCSARRLYAGFGRARSATWSEVESVRAVASGHATRLRRWLDPGATVVVRANGRELVVAGGLSGTEADDLRNELETARRAAAERPAPAAFIDRTRRRAPTPEEQARGPDDRRQALVAALPSFAFDAVFVVAAWLVGGMLGGWLDQGGVAEDRFQAYQFGAYLAFCAGLVVRRWDAPYVANLRRIADRDFRWTFGYVVLGGVNGVMALLTAKPLLDALGTNRMGDLGIAVNWAAFLVIAPLSPVLHGLLVRRARRTSGATPSRRAATARWAATLLLLPLAIGANAAAYKMFGSRSERLGILNLPIAAMVAAVAYLPFRMHVFVESSGRKGSIASFVLACAALALHAILRG